MARKKTVFQGLNIGPDVELLLLVGAGLTGVYWLWTTYGSSAVSSIESGISSATSSVEGAFSGSTDDSQA